MAFQDILNSFQSLLGRDDVDTTKAALFLQQGMRRITNECRLPNMERQLIITPDADMASFVVPSDLIQPIDVIVTDPMTGLWRVLDKKSYRQLMDHQRLPIARYYARLQSQIWLAGPCRAGGTLRFVYYGGYSTITDYSLDNELTAANPDLVLFAGLRYGGDDSQHPNTGTWEATYQMLKASAIQAGIDIDAEGGPQTLALPYEWD